MRSKKVEDFLVTTLKFIYARVASQKAKKERRKSEHNVLKFLMEKCIKIAKKSKTKLFSCLKKVELEKARGFNAS